MVSKARLKATAKYEQANYDKVLVRLPKGTKDRIKRTGESMNGMITRLLLDELDRIENKNK